MVLQGALERGGEPANHSEAAAFGPSPGKFKPRKFAKTDVVVRGRTRQLRCDWLAPCLSLVLLELDPRFLNNVRATSCREMANMNT
ncbi:hypothetical protein E2C01_092046 [Portunus trituberculatus]|uniref:Uncharacterized protein n=1 Tax=Portunus trituberculatus TaxID=210409 RepID=A0A5B7JPK6_PORTR|nr:hypothetical protein [Portunus trituberculatus]